MAEEEDVRSLFGTQEPDVLGELESMVRLHNISAEDLFFKWESYCIEMERDAQEVTLPAVRNLKQALQDKLEKASHRQLHMKSEAKAKPSIKGGAGADVFGMLDGLVPSTPTMRGGLKKKQQAVASPAPGMNEQLKQLSVTTATFAQRANPGEVLEVLNERLEGGEGGAQAWGEARVKLAAASDQKKMGYKTLAMKISEASEILDDRIDDFIDMVREHHGLEDSAFGNAATVGTAEMVAVGRIASDSLVEGRLNAASLVLETSRRTGRGLRVPLKMDRGIRSWSFFPGQIVALRGSNTTGNEFTVKQVLEIPLLPNAASTPATLQTHRERMRGGPDAMESDGDPAPLTIFYAAGPYTADDNLDYEPLRALCEQAAERHADAVILTGPFLDADHPLIATGDFDLPDDTDADTATMATVFKHLVTPAINRLASSMPHAAIVLVPSVRDVLAKHVCWPQDALPRRELGLAKSVRAVSNPMTLLMNEVVVGVSSQDVLYELRNEEVSVGGGELMGRLCRYLIEQRHYFPVFPAMNRARLPRTGTEEGVGMGAVVDVGYGKLGEMVGTRPDVMLVPSSLPPFAKVVESVLVINPGFLSKRRGPGTYARMTLHAPSLEGEMMDGFLGHGVYDRARVEIVRI